MRPYIRGTCNPDADSWAADFLAWWIDPESGLAIPERAGVLRYYVRVAEKTIWADRPEELTEHLPQAEGSLLYACLGNLDAGASSRQSSWSVTISTWSIL